MFTQWIHLELQQISLYLVSPSVNIGGGSLTQQIRDQPQVVGGALHPDGNG